MKNYSLDFARQLKARLSKGGQPPSKRQAKAGRRFVHDMIRKAQPGSMMNRGQPKGYRPPCADERTRTLFAAYRRRVAAKQDISAARG